jgi:hypothetical protein
MMNATLNREAPRAAAIDHFRTSDHAEDRL